MSQNDENIQPLFADVSDEELTAHPTPSPLANRLMQYPSTEAEFLNKFREHHGRDKLLMVQRLGDGIDWMVFDGKRWAKKHIGVIETMMSEFAIQQYQKFLAEFDADELEEFMSLKTKPAAFTLLKKYAESPSIIKRNVRPCLPHEMYEAELGDFDRPRNLLNVQNGTIDLSTGKLLPHNPADLLTHICDVDYDPSVKSPLWEKFLDDVTCGDKDFLADLQKVLGYCITGEVNEQKIFLMVGPNGSNGKSTMMYAVANILGLRKKDSLAAKLNKGLFVKKWGCNVDYAKIAMRTARMGFAPETDRGDTINEDLVKDLTGDAILEGRNPAQAHATWENVTKLIQLTNYSPKVNTMDKSLIRRLYIMVFRANFEDRKDKDMVKKLYEEAQGILTWLVEGSVSWYQTGLQPCQATIEATSNYVMEYNPDIEFITTQMDITEHRKISGKNFFDIYKKWCKAEHNRDAMNYKEFNLKMESYAEMLGFRKVINPNGKTLEWHGIAESFEKEGLPLDIQYQMQKNKAFSDDDDLDDNLIDDLDGVVVPEVITDDESVDLFISDNVIVSPTSSISMLKLEGAMAAYAAKHKYPVPSNGEMRKMIKNRLVYNKFDICLRKSKSGLLMIKGVCLKGEEQRPRKTEPTGRGVQTVLDSVP